MGIEEKKFVRLGKDFLSSSVKSPHIVNYARNVFEDTRKDMEDNVKQVSNSVSNVHGRPQRTDRLNFSMALDGSSVK